MPRSPLAGMKGADRPPSGYDAVTKSRHPEDCARKHRWEPFSAPLSPRGHSAFAACSPPPPSWSPSSCRPAASVPDRSEEHTSELQSRGHIVCRLLLEKTNG